MAGVLMRYVHRYKIVLVVGLAIRLLYAPLPLLSVPVQCCSCTCAYSGVGLMIHSRGAQASDAEVVWTQIIQGFGGGFASVCSSVAAQASVPHVDMAMTTAMVLLWTEIGGAVGSAIGE